MCSTCSPPLSIPHFRIPVVFAIPVVVEAELFQFLILGYNPKPTTPSAPEHNFQFLILGYPLLCASNDDLAIVFQFLILGYEPGDGEKGEEGGLSIPHFRIPSQSSLRHA